MGADRCLSAAPLFGPAAAAASGFVLNGLCVGAGPAMHAPFQCDISTGSVIVCSMERVTPPNASSQARGWP